jgi:hypothetical protein
MKTVSPKLPFYLSTYASFCEPVVSELFIAIEFMLISHCYRYVLLREFHRPIAIKEDPK